MSANRAYMSFGAGVQSTAIAMLAINRDERLLKVTGGIVPELYIFADTGDEPKALYPHVADMKARIEASGAKFLTVSRGRLSMHVESRALEGRKGMDNPPVFMWSKKCGKFAPSRRGCTSNWKSAVMDRCAKDIYGRSVPPVQHWYGISKDEYLRERAHVGPKNAWRVAVNPLLLMNWHRADCINYLVPLGIQPRKSACVFCPYHSNAQWREVKSVPEDWAQAVALEKSVQEGFAKHGHFAGLKNGLPYFTNQGVPLEQADFSVKDDPQQRLWDNECAGICGV